MDLKKTGTFIAQRRKEKELTQGQLAAHLGVTDKAVSRWETGRGFPDVSTLPALAEALGVTVAELVNGEAAEPTQESTSAQDAVLSSLEYANGVKRRLIRTLLLVCSGLCFLYAFLMVGAGSMVKLLFLGTVLLLIAGWMFLLGGFALHSAFSPRVSRIGAMLMLLAALVLELLPGGVRMHWATPPGEPERVTSCAYWSMLPAGYGNLFPLLTAILTAVLLLCTLYRLLRPGARGGSGVFIANAVCLLLAALSAFLFADDQPTPLSLAILLCIFFGAVLQALALRDA